MNKLILYTSENGKHLVQLRAEQKTVWLTQLEVAALFNANKQGRVGFSPPIAHK